MNNGKSIKIGEIYDRLTVLNITKKRDTQGNIIVQCQCACNNIIDKSSAVLKNRKTASCGCAILDSAGKASWNLHFLTYKMNAKKRNLDFHLSFAQFKDICEKNCYYCGVFPRKFNKYLGIPGKEHLIERSWILVNGIDRIDSSKGYNLINCDPCCSRCNEAKMDMPRDQFKAWIKKTYLHLFQKESNGN